MNGPKLTLTLLLSLLAGRVAAQAVRPACKQPVLLPRVECEDPLAVVPGIGSCYRHHTLQCLPPNGLDSQSACRLANTLGCNDPRCLTCSPSNKAACTQCIDGYGLDGSGACRKCTDPLCRACGPPDKCLTCWDFNGGADGGNLPVFKNAAGACKECTAQPAPCARCDKTGKRCLACQPNYLLDAKGKCQPCADPCCDVCTQKGTKCVKCAAHARGCNASTTGPSPPEPTTKYIHPHYRPPHPVYLNTTSGLCTEVLFDDLKGCFVFDSQLRCLKCEAGQRLSRGACVPCKGRDPPEAGSGNVNCVDCGGSSGLCQACVDGFGVNTTDPLKQCVPCAGKYCVRCARDFRKCLDCLPCAAECDIPPCSADACDDSIARAYLTGGRCKKCDRTPNCWRCNPNGSCKSCKSGFKLNSKKECVACKQPSRCERCDAADCAGCDPAGLVCQLCGRGGGRDDACQPCTAPCTQCSNATFCTECGESPSGFSVYLTPKGQCKECKLPGCNYCNATGACTDCTGGWTLAGGKGSCLRCSDALCARCSKSAQHCEECEYDAGNGTSVYMDKKGACRACQVERCLTCDLDARDGTCAGCVLGWTPAPDRKSCQPCSVAHCSQCDGGAAQCDACEDGFSVSAGKKSCVACGVAHCRSCASDLQKCDICMDGLSYDETTNQCTK